MSHSHLNEDGIKIRNTFPKERKVDANLLFTRNNGGARSGAFELRLEFQHGTATVYLTPDMLADMLSHAYKKVTVHVHGALDPKSEPKCMSILLKDIPAKFKKDNVDYKDRDNILKQPKLLRWIGKTVARMNLSEVVVTFNRTNIANGDSLSIQEIL